MPDLVCEGCGEGFWQGQGRPAKRCLSCRDDQGRYGAAHKRARAATVDQAAGKPCARCGVVMLEGQPVQLDHADDGSGRYLGYSHQSCNARAGAVASNRARAAAYRALRGMGAMPAANGSRTHAPPPEQPSCRRTSEEIKAHNEANPKNLGLPCICGKLTSRCW